MRKRIIATMMALTVIFSQSVLVNASVCSHNNTEHVSTQNASCTTSGYAEGVFCNDCNKYISGHEKINPLGHIDSNTDNNCDDCGMKFESRKAQKETCVKNGYTGDVVLNSRVVIGENIPATGHKDNDADFICDTCHEKITKNPIKITLHYYITEEDYEENKSEYSKKNYTVKMSNSVPGCMYITEKRTEIQNTEFRVPAAPNVKDFKFAWTSDNTVYKKFAFNEDKELFMSFIDNNQSLEGQAGPKAYYIYHPEEKELEFVGTGSLWSDFESKSEIPWYKYLIKSEKVILNNKITAKLWTIRKPKAES